MKNSFKTIFCFLTGTFSTLCTFGQIENIIIPGDLKQETIITEPTTLRKGYLRTGIRSIFIFEDKQFDEQSNRNYILNLNGWNKSSRYILDLYYGISDRIEIFASIPFVNSQTYISIFNVDRGLDSSFLYTNKSKAIGFGDLETGIRYQIITENERRPSIRGGLYVTYPTGRKNPENIKTDEIYDSPTGNGHFTTEAEIKLRKVFYPYSVNFSAFFFYNIKGKKIWLPNEPEIEFKKGNIFAFYTGFNFHINDWIAITNDVSFTTAGESMYYYDETYISPGGWVLEYKPAIFFQIRKFRFEQKIQIPLIGKNWSADPSYSIGLSYLF